MSEPTNLGDYDLTVRVRIVRRINAMPGDLFTAVLIDKYGTEYYLPVEWIKGQWSGPIKESKD